MIDPAEGEVSRRTAFIRNNGTLTTKGQQVPSFTIISNRCAHLGCPVQANGPSGKILGHEERRREDGERHRHARAGRARRLRLPVPRRPVRHRGQPHRRPARARARPLRVRGRQRPPDPAQHVLRLARRRHRRAGEDPQVQVGRPRRARRRARAALLSASTRRTTRWHVRRQPTRAEVRKQQLTTRSTTRSTGSRSGRGSSAASSTSSSARSRPTRTGCRRSARRRFTAFLVQAITGVILAMYYQPTPARRVLVDPEHHRPRDDGLARARHAPLGRERLHHPHVPAHGPRVPLRRVQVPARAELDHRRAPARDGDDGGFTGYLLPWDQTAYWATRRRHQPERDGAVPGAVVSPVLTWRPGDRRGDADALLLDAHAADPGRDLRADRPAPVSRDPPRRHVAAVVEGGRGHGRAEDERQGDAAAGPDAPGRRAAAGGSD